MSESDDVFADGKEDLDPMVRELLDRVRSLEAELAELKQQLQTNPRSNVTNRRASPAKPDFRAEQAERLYRYDSRMAVFYTFLFFGGLFMYLVSMAGTSFD